MREQFAAVQEENQSLAEEKTKLTEVVSRASMLEVAEFSCTTLNKRDRKTSFFSQIQKLEFHYTVGKNITCEPGLKTVCLRLTRPDGELMLKSGARTFNFESGTLEASVMQEIEYAGEEISGTMYWAVDEILQTGTYTADFFIDSQHVGNFTFTLKK